LCLLLGVGRRFRQELLEIFQEIRSSVEKLSNLSVDVLDRLGLSLVGLQDLKELLVNLWGGRETVLGRNVSEEKSLASREK
jgi:hypothetical protein